MSPFEASNPTSFSASAVFDISASYRSFSHFGGLRLFLASCLAHFIPQRLKSSTKSPLFLTIAITLLHAASDSATRRSRSSGSSVRSSLLTLPYTYLSKYASAGVASRRISKTPGPTSISSVRRTAVSGSCASGFQHQSMHAPIAGAPWYRLMLCRNAEMCSN